MYLHLFVLGCLSLLVHLSAMAGENQVWLVGGGPNLFSSQVQIEANVLWAQKAISGLPGKRRIRIRFTDGNDPAADVVEWREPAETRVEKIEHLMELSARLAVLESVGPQAVRERYQSLVACESAPF